MLGSKATASFRSFIFVSSFVHISGTHIECIYELISMGISPKTFPVDPATGTVNLDMYLPWLTMRQRIEAEEEQQYRTNSTKEEELQLHEPIQQLAEIGMIFKIPEKPDMSQTDRPAATIDSLRTDDNRSCDRQSDNINDDTKLDIKMVERHNYERATTGTPDTSSSSSSGVILEPGPFDVVFGRGKGNQNRPGNARLRVVVNMYMEQYEQADRIGKTTISENVIRIIQDSSGKFLREDTSANDGGWVEVTDLEEVRKKVSHAFRARRAAQQKEQQQQQQQQEEELSSSKKTSSKKKPPLTKVNDNGNNCKNQKNKKSMTMISTNMFTKHAIDR